MESVYKLRNKGWRNALSSGPGFLQLPKAARGHEVCHLATFSTSAHPWPLTPDAWLNCGSLPVPSSPEPGSHDGTPPETSNNTLASFTHHYPAHQSLLLSVLFISGMGMVAYTHGNSIVKSDVTIDWINLRFTGSVIGLIAYVRDIMNL